MASEETRNLKNGETLVGIVEEQVLLLEEE